MYAGPIKDFDEFLADIIKYDVIVSDTNHMTNIGFTEYFTGGLRVTTGHKYKFKFGFNFP